MTMGYSGALVTQVRPGVMRKSAGTTNIALQASLMRYIGSDVCPRVIATGKTVFHADYYDMEELQPLETPRDVCALDHRLDLVMDVLDAMHRRDPLSPDPCWESHLNGWTSGSAPWIPIYEHVQGERLLCLTHGDPTLSNVMLGWDLRIRLIDPTPERRGVPPLAAVDHGKLIQSAVGWEHMLDSSWPTPNQNTLDAVLSRLGRKRQRCEALFWGAYHCARFVVKGKTPEVCAWGEEKSRLLIARMYEEESRP